MNAMSYRVYFSILVVLCFSSFGGSLAHATDGEWTTVASACVPDETSVGQYQFEQARFEFSAGDFGQIVARCNITDPADLFEGNPIWDRMDVTYNDTNIVNSRVRVQLRRVHETTGASATIGTFDSNLFGVGQVGQQLRSLGFNHVFDFSNFAYYLTIILDRANAAIATPQIQRVRLYRTPVG